MSRYILNKAGEPVREPSLKRWASWMEDAGRCVESTQIGQCRVSTVFLGLDYGLEGPPILWETMVWGGPLRGAQDRCSGSREQAEAMHSAMVREVMMAQDD